MKLFIDSADINEIREVAGWGILDGCTTNPSLVCKTGRPFKECVQDILKVVSGPVSVEAMSTDAVGMIREGEDWATLDPEKVAIKIPMSVEGLKAIRALRERRILTNCTLIFSPTQALLACRAGATFISPFVGRLDDISHDGIDLVGDVVEIIGNYGFETEVIAASLRHPLHVVQSARVGSHIATVPYKVFLQMVKHPLTDAGITKFRQDYEKIPKP